RADGRRLDLSGRAGEKPVVRGTGTLDGDWPASLAIDTAVFPAQALVDAFPQARALGATLGARGDLKLDLDLLRPGGFRYAASDLVLSGAVRDFGWSTDPFRLAGDAETLTVEGARITARGTTLSLDGRVALAPTARFDLAVAGDADLEAITLAQPELRLGGKASLPVRLAGTPEAPDTTGDLTLDGVRGRFEGARWSELTLRARFLGSDVDVEELTARLLGGRLRAGGRLPLRPRARENPVRLTFEATDVDLARVMDVETRAQPGASLLVSVDGEIESGEPAVAALRGHGRISRLESKSPEGAFGLDAPASWTLEGGRFVQSPLRVTGPQGTLEAAAEAILGGEAPGGTAQMEGPFDLAILSPFLPDATVSGPARIDAQARWGGEGLRLDGGLSVKEARIALEEVAFAATSVSADVRLLGDRASLEATGAAGEGRLRA